jgi:hypothetical protein
MSESPRVINAIIALLGVLLAILVGLAWSRGVLSRGTFGFDLGYLPVALGASRVLSARVAGISRRQLRWLPLLGPVLPVFIFEALAAYALNRLHARLSVDRLVLFASFSAVMLLMVLILLVRFDYEEGFGPFSPNERRLGRRWTLFAAVVLGILVIWGPIHVVIALEKPSGLLPASVYKALAEIESWFYRCSLVVYLFVIVRMLFPTLQDRIFGPERGNPLTKNQAG